MLRLLASTPAMDFIEISYPALVRDPAPILARLEEFLGSDKLPYPDRMLAAVDPSLHRKKY